MDCKQLAVLLIPPAINLSWWTIPDGGNMSHWMLGASFCSNVGTCSWLHGLWHLLHTQHPTNCLDSWAWQWCGQQQLHHRGQHWWRGTFCFDIIQKLIVCLLEFYRLSLSCSVISDTLKLMSCYNLVLYATSFIWMLTYMHFLPIPGATTRNLDQWEPETGGNRDHQKLVKLGERRVHWRWVCCLPWLK